MKRLWMLLGVGHAFLHEILEARHRLSFARVKCLLSSEPAAASVLVVVVGVGLHSLNLTEVLLLGRALLLVHLRMLLLLWVLLLNGSNVASRLAVLVLRRLVLLEVLLLRV